MSPDDVQLLLADVAIVISPFRLPGPAAMPPGQRSTFLPAGSPRPVPAVAELRKQASRSLPLSQKGNHDHDR